VNSPFFELKKPKDRKGFKLLPRFGRDACPYLLRSSGSQKPRYSANDWELLQMRFLSMACATAVLFVATPVLASENSPKVEIGTLSCLVEGEHSFIVGSSAKLGCSFKPAGDGAVEYYSGKVRDYGLDIGKTKEATLVWGVLAPSANRKPGLLAGTYGGLTAGASLGAGIKANALVGGFDRSIALNPFSLESQTGTNLTLGVSKMTLERIN
jgi:Protein of unknown function (DUF992)